MKISLQSSEQNVVYNIVIFVYKLSIEHSTTCDFRINLNFNVMPIFIIT